MPARLDTTPCPTPAWLPEGHSQTIHAAAFARRPRIAFRRERIATPDGDFVDFDWADAPDASDALVLFHGLEGNSASSYAQSIAHHFNTRLGWTVAIPHFRGCSGEPNLLARAYHSGDSAEVAFMLDTARARRPQARWHAAGVSLGGNALLKHLGEAGSQAGWLAAAAGISAPLDLMAAGHALGAGFVNRYIYTQVFLKTLKAKVQHKARRFPDLIDAARVARARDLYEFDNAYTAPLHGFRDTEDYWTRASSKPLLAGIAVPTLVLNARNDPFLPGRYLPRPTDASARVVLHQPAHGGHAGFPSGAFPSNLDWLPRRLEAFFRGEQ